MNEMQNELNRYYEEASIASVEEIDGDGFYDYEEMFRSFRCPKKDSCREVCKKAYEKACERSDEAPEFLFSPPPRTECIPVSQYYEKREYEGHRIPRIVVVSLSAPKPELKPPCPTENIMNSQRRGTTTTVRSLLCPFIDLAPAGDGGDKSTEIIEQLCVHIRTGKCCSNVGGTDEEPYQLYKNCGGYLKKEVSILKPDVVVTQGNTAHCMSKQYVFDGIAKRPVECISDSIARIVHLREDKRRVYWLRSRFPTVYAGFYSPDHAGLKIDSESQIVGAKRQNLVLYGKDIERFMEER